jgi:gamma-glutamyltranspeptidase/glutathione hydrolase
MIGQGGTPPQPRAALIMAQPAASAFTTRPQIRGTFGVVASTHWIGSAVGMAMLERGGNAFDAAVACAFSLQMVEPHLCGPAGEAPILFHDAARGEVRVLCGQGPAPAAATPARFAELGLDMIPGAGLLAAVIPGAFDAWLTLLRDYGTLSLDEVMAPAIGYAEHGQPLLPGAARALAEVEDTFKTEWRSSEAVWLPQGRPPEANRLFRNPALTATYRRILAEAAAGGGARERRIDRARAAWSQGFVAEAIDRFCAAEPLMDSSGERHRGLLTGQDMAGWQAGYEAPITSDYRGWTICKTGPWGQGPVLLQALKLLEGFAIGAIGPTDPELVHLALEALALACADRDAYYGDPDFTAVPLDVLLSEAYASERRGLIGREASAAFRPGVVPGYEAQVARAAAMVRSGAGSPAAAGVGEPTMAHLRPSLKPSDTTHIDVIDRHGNMVSATPSGGWPQSSPTVPGLGFALGTRLQMFWLEPGLPGTLAPGKRPRTTLTPTLALNDGRPSLVCGSPGGDQQDQWQLILLLRRIDQGLGLQQAIDLPMFHTLSLISSFYPREARLGQCVLESGFDAATVSELRARGHAITTAPPWSVGRLTAAERDGEGVLSAAASPRLMQAYAVGR